MQVSSILDLSLAVVASALDRPEGLLAHTRNYLRAGYATLANDTMSHAGLRMGISLWRESFSSVRVVIYFPQPRAPRSPSLLSEILGIGGILLNVHDMRT